MTRKLLPFILGLMICFSGCSADDDGTTEEQPINDGRHFNINVNGTELALYPNDALDHCAVNRIGDYIDVHGGYGYGMDSEQQHQFRMRLKLDVGVMYVQQNSFSDEFGFFVYENYPNFMSHYFQVNVVSVDDVAKRIKLNFSGKLYLDRDDLTSESIDISGDLDLDYTLIENQPPQFQYNGIEQYCTAKFNGTPWNATMEPTYSVFTNSGDYRIETHFSQAALPGSYAFTPSSTDNYIKFSRFNTQTLTYDYYNVTGTIAHSYREFHGGTNYSYIGTYEFTAINPNNPSDIIHVTDGVFRSYQHF